MPEGRMLKKCISDSKKLGALTSDSARLLYTWLLPHLDVEGRYSADPEIIKGHIFPKVKSMTVSKIKKLLLNLDEIGLIILYRNNSEDYLQLKQFTKYQKIDKKKEASSKILAYTSVDSVITPANSRVTPENSSTSKVNVSKVNESKEKAESLYEKLFKDFWEAYPKKVARDVAKEKFMILMRQGLSKEIVRAFNGYVDYLKMRKVRDNFDQEVLNPATFLMKNRWKDYVDFKYSPPL